MRKPKDYDARWKSASERPRDGSRERGFALLLVVLISALASVTAVALLDLVDLDLGVAAEHSKSVTVGALASEAVREVIADVNNVQYLPDFQSPNLTTRYVGRDASGNLFKGPDSPASAELSSANSVVVRNEGTQFEEGYEAEAMLIGIGPAEDSGFTVSQALHYEIAVTASSGRGAYTKEHRIGVTRLIALPPGTLLNPMHAR